MKVVVLSLSLLLLCSISFGQTKILTGKDARHFDKNAEMVRLHKRSVIPSFIKLNSDAYIGADQFESWISNKFELSHDFSFESVSILDDDYGFSHIRYAQLYKGIPVEGATYIVHLKNGKIASMNGDLFNAPHFEGTKSISLSEAIMNAKKHVGADVYRWELPEEEEHLKDETGNPNATYYPAEELVYAAVNGKFFENKFRLAYKLDIYAQSPMYRAYVFVDAETGEILFENKRLYDVDAIGSATTAYSGVRTITADSFGGGYRLRESGRGNGVNTYNMQNGTSYGAAVDFTDSDNNWNSTGIDQYATDAHWGAEMTYDYYWLEHNRNSIDGNGFTLNSYVHYDNGYANAFWDGQRMTYGDGSGSITPLTAIDIAGHEITHGLTNFTADLVYQDESGALNESFSDIFGAAIEFYALGAGNGDWLIGEDIGSVIRSMNNPNAYGDPDTYFGNNWAPLGGADNGGVHTNSGVQNFWFYLLSAGGSGMNDIGNSYNVTSIGIDNAAAIAFRNLTVYLTQNSDYADARFYSILAATDIFGACSPEVISTTNAWHAVGVGDAYDPTFTTDFNPSVTGGCQNPFTVDFTAFSASSGTGTYSWDFGDGNTGSGLNTTHTYMSNGTYTVTLIEDGGPCGIDTAIQVDVINVGALNPPSVTDAADCSGPATMNLYASGVGALTWYDAPTGGNQIGSGNTYTTPSISNTTSFWVESATGVAPDSVGPVDNSFGNGGYFTGNQNLVFDAYTPFTLVSVWVDANGGGNRTIELRDDQGTLLDDTTINVPNGSGRITLNFDVPAGTGHTITSPSPDLYRNSDGASYPYTLSGICEITGSTAGDPGYYYFFYDWEIMTTPCSSDRVEVIAAIAAPPTAVEDSICGTGTVDLTASGSGLGSLNWFDAPTGGTQLGSGTTFTTPSISSTTTYYVEEQIPGQTFYGGPVNNAFGGGGFFTGDQHLIFDVYQAITLESVLVYANGAGNRTIELRDNNGVVLQDTTINIPAGANRITLSFDLVPGTDYQLGTTAGSAPDLYRNNSGPTYPYDVPGIVSITESSAGQPGYYYFFYDWELKEPDCITSRVPVDAIINTQQDASITPVSAYCPTDPAFNLIAAESGGTWSGTGITDANAGTFDPSIAGNGQHQIIYTLSGTCGDVDTITISVNSALDATIAPVSAQCEDGTPITLSAADNGGVWSGTGITDPSNGIFDPATAGLGTHTVTYTIGGACGDTQTEDIVVLPREDASVNPAGPYCETDTFAVMTSTNSGGYWSGTGITDSTNGTFNPQLAGPGSHTVFYTISGTCGDQGSTNIVVGTMPNASINPVDPVCLEENAVLLTSPTGGGTFSGTAVSGSFFDPQTAGIGMHWVYYTVNTGNGCIATDSTQIEVVSCLGITDYNDYLTSVYPNPNAGTFQIDIRGKAGSDGTLDIMDARGRAVHSQAIPGRSQLMTVTIPELSSGMYMIRLNYGDKIEYARVIVR